MNTPAVAMHSSSSSSRFLLLPYLFTILVFSTLIQEGVCISCIQCEADVVLGGDDSCITNPPKAKPCERSMSVCMTIRTYMPAEQENRMLTSLVRTCSPTDMGWDCEKGKNDHGQVAEVCHDTCSWDGCNSAHADVPFRSLWLILGSICIGLML